METKDTTAARERLPLDTATLLASVSDARARELVALHGPNEGARTYLEELRWPQGVSCPRCNSGRTGWLEAREKHYCRDCSYQFRVTAGTLFHDSHVSLARWLVAIQCLLDADRGFPATQLRHVIGGNYKTAWFVGHRIRAAMSRSLLDLGMPLALAEAIHASDPVPEGTTESRAVLEGPAGEGWARVKRLVAGAYHRPSAAHLAAYWNEARWRATHLDNADVFRETVLALLEAEPLPYRELTGHARPYGTLVRTGTATAPLPALS